MFARLLLLTVCVSIITCLGCSGAIDKVVDNRVSSMVAKQNEKLPAEVSDGVTLNKLEYDKDSNHLTLLYTCVDPEQIKANLRKLEHQTNERARSDGSITQAMEQGIKIEHKFYGEGQKAPFASFETKAN